MKILVVSATEKEILPVKNKLKVNKSTVCVMKYGVIKDFSVDFLVTGVGGVFTAYALTKTLGTKKYDLVINAGIAGSFTKDLTIGEVVFVETDEFADLGIEDNDAFFTLFEKGFIKEDETPFQNGKLENPNNFDLDIKKVSAITVNTTHGNKQSIELFQHKFGADIESMEGAACAYVCAKENKKYMQIRSISNYVEERDQSKWNIPLAIETLNEKLYTIIDKMS
jgi:futalosine hydrolase